MPHFYSENEVKKRDLLPGVTARLIWGNRIMTGIIDIAPGAVVPAHSHPHEQCGRVLRGAAWFTVGGEKKLLKVGDHYVIPGGVEHLVEATAEGCQALDIWSPIREEYITDEVKFFSKE
jgi:quercetin dioxygenase-like cupin family protein